MHELQIYRGVISNDTKEWWKIWRGTDLWFQNWHKEFDKFWHKNSHVLKVHILMSCFRPMYIMFELKKYRQAIVRNTRVGFKIYRKTDLWFGKSHEEFGRIFTRTHKILKIGTFIGSFNVK